MWKLWSCFFLHQNAHRKNMVLEPDCRGSGLELPYQAWRAFRKLHFVVYFIYLLLLCQLIFINAGYLTYMYAVTYKLHSFSSVTSSPQVFASISLVFHLQGCFLTSENEYLVLVKHTVASRRLYILYILVLVRMLWMMETLENLVFTLLFCQLALTDSFICVTSQALKRVKTKRKSPSNLLRLLMKWSRCLKIVTPGPSVYQKVHFSF